MLNNPGATVAKIEKNLSRPLSPDEMIERIRSHAYEAGKKSGVSTGMLIQRTLTDGLRTIAELKESLNLSYLCDGCGCVIYDDSEICITCERKK